MLLSVTKKKKKKTAPRLIPTTAGDGALRFRSGLSSAAGSRRVSVRVLGPRPEALASASLALLQFTILFHPPCLKVKTIKKLDVPQ